MSKYRMLAIDIDGTLLNEKKSISSKTKESINKVRDLGITVILSTGRGYQRVKYLREELNLDGPMVLVNGAEVRTSGEEILYSSFMRQEDIQALHQLAIDTGATFWGYTSDAFKKGADWTEEDIAKSNWLKFGIKHEDLNLIVKLREEIAEFEQVKVTSSAPFNIECAFKGMSKEVGVRAICKYLDIDISEVVAIGDNMNDYEMLNSVGLGIAMGNGAKELKDIADDVTKTNEADGLAYAINKHFLEETLNK